MQMNPDIVPLLAPALLSLILVLQIALLVRRGVLDLWPVEQTWRGVAEFYQPTERTVREEIGGARRETGEMLSQSRRELAESLRSLGSELHQDVGAAITGVNTSLVPSVGEMGNLQKAQLAGFGQRLERLTQTNEQKMDALRAAVEARLARIQEDNATRLEQMRATVDEKLQGTLELRLGESYRQVSERLEMVAASLWGDAHARYIAEFVQRECR